MYQTVDNMGRSACPCIVTGKVFVVFPLLLAILLVTASTLTQVIYKQKTKPSLVACHITGNK